MEEDNRYYLLSVTTERIAKEIGASASLSKLLARKDDRNFVVNKYDRGQVKLLLIKLGYPVDDRIALAQGEPVAMSLRANCASTSRPFVVRDYQLEATSALLGDGQGGSGFGVIVLPCGSGKTIVGMLAPEIVLHPASLALLRKTVSRGL